MTPMNHFARPPVAKTALFLRWLVLLVVAFDLLSAPLHAHAHDMGPGMMLPHAHQGALDDMDVDDHDGMTHAQALVHNATGHSNAALRAVEGSFPPAPSLDIIVASVWALLVEPRAEAVAPSSRSAAADHIPIPSRCTWRPEGRAPPVLHS